MSPMSFQSPSSKTNTPSINPVPTLLANENKEGVVGAKHFRDISSPIPFQSSKSEVITPSFSPVLTSNKEAHKPKVEGAQIPATGFEKETNVKDYDRPESLRTGFLSPIPFNTNLSKANTTTLTASTDST